MYQQQLLACPHRVTSSSWNTGSRVETGRRWCCNRTLVRLASKVSLYSLVVFVVTLFVHITGKTDPWQLFRSSSDINLADTTLEKDEISEPVLAQHTLPRPIVDYIFNDSCPVQYLGLPDFVAQSCDLPSVNPTGNTSSTDILVSTPSYCQELTCRNILTGNSSGDIYRIAKEFMKVHSRPILRDMDLVDLTSDCAEFRRRRGFDKKLSMTENSDFPIAFNLIVHKSAEQVERLLYALYRPQNQFCIHVDDGQRSDAFLMAVRGISSCFSNVFVASKREKIHWGGYSRLQADINCMRDHVSRGGNWKYLINTAGQAFPLHTNSEMVRILRIYNGSNDIEGIYGRRLIKDRYEKEYVELPPDVNPNDRNRIKKTGRANPPPPHNIKIVRGSAYGVFSREFIEFVLNDEVAKALLNWSRSTWSPDEHYWATLHHTSINPSLKTPGAFSDYPSATSWMAVFVNWDRKSCRGKIVRGICVLGVADLPSIIDPRIRHELFVNKLYADFEPLALDCLGAWLSHKEACPVELDEQFYRDLPRVKLWQKQQKVTL